MSDFLYLKDAGVLLRVEDITVVFFDEIPEGNEFITVDMRRNNTKYKIPVPHEDFLRAFHSALGEPYGGDE